MRLQRTAIKVPRLQQQSGDPELRVTASFSEERLVRPSDPIELLLGRPLRESDGRLGILIGDTDVSSLFSQVDLRLRYNAKLWPLPLGESTVTVYLVSNTDEWKELERFTLVVDKEKTTSREKSSLSSPNDFEARFIKTNYFDRLVSMLNPHMDLSGESTNRQEPTEPSSSQSGKKGKINFVPALTFTLKTRPAQSALPPPGESEVAGFADISMQGTLNNEATYGSFSSQSNADFAGSSFQQEALRYGDLRGKAPKVDLSSYLLQFQTGRVKYQVGHFSFGSQRHLIDSFQSRGITIAVPFLKLFDFSAAAMSGTQLLGYNNFFGVSERKHQIFSGTLGMELFPKRPGGLRLEVGVAASHFEPLNGVNRGLIIVEQRSRGFTLRLLAKDKDERFHFEAGFTRSFSVYPSEDETIAELPGLTSNAHYLTASYQILKDFALSKSRRANLTLTFTEENVAPQFLSPGATTQADKIKYGFSVSGSVDEITGQFAYVNGHDNLRNVPSMFRGLSGVANVSIAAPSKALLGRTKDSPWLPRLSYIFRQDHGFDVAIPVNDGFEVDLFSIKNLLVRQHTFNADWLIKKLTIGYKFDHTLSDDRRSVNELADASDTVNIVQFSIPVNSKLNLNLDLSSERFARADRENGEIACTYRLAPGIAWKVTKRIELNGSLSNTIASVGANISHDRNTRFDASWIYHFGARGEGLKKQSGKFFLTYSNGYQHSLDHRYAIDSLRKDQTLTANLSFTLFQ